MAIATFLFWNVRRNLITDLVAQAAIEQDVDVLILAESVLPVSDLLLRLNTNQPRKFRVPFSPSDRISFYVRYPASNFGLVFDDDRISVRRIRPPLGQEVLVVAAHLPSKLWRSDDDQLLYACQVSEEIQKTERSVGHDRTVLVGDLNMNPFDPGMVAARGIHGVMDREIVRSGFRRVDNREYKFFYNPMWSHMGDQSKGPPGTFRRSESGQIAYFWHTLDQVLVRSSLITSLERGRLEVLTNVGGVDLLGGGGSPRSAISDHLPIVFALEL